MIKKKQIYLSFKKNTENCSFMVGGAMIRRYHPKTENISYINDKYFDGDIELDLFSDRAMLEKCAPLIAQKLVN